MERLSVRLTDRMFRQLDELAGERGVTRTRLVRQLLEAGLRDRDSIPPPDTPSEEELIELLAERARMGNVAAIRALLVREEQRDPRERALLCPRAARSGASPVSKLLTNAFKALGPDAGAREIELVAATLRTAGDEQVLGMLEKAADDWRAFEALCRVAEEAGASGFAALDLATAVGGGRLVR